MLTLRCPITKCASRTAILPSQLTTISGKLTTGRLKLNHLIYKQLNLWKLLKRGCKRIRKIINSSKSFCKVWKKKYWRNNFLINRCLRISKRRSNSIVFMSICLIKARSWMGAKRDGIILTTGILWLRLISIWVRMFLLCLILNGSLCRWWLKSLLCARNCVKILIYSLNFLSLGLTKYWQCSSSSSFKKGMSQNTKLT